MGMMGKKITHLYTMTQAGRCAGTLSKQDVTPAAPSALPYVNTGMNNIDTVGHASYFKSSDPTNCPITSCKLLQKDCKSDRPPAG